MISRLTQARSDQREIKERSRRDQTLTMISTLDFDLSIHFAALQCLKHRMGRRGIRCLARLCTTLCGPLPLKRGVCINPGPEFPLGISSRSDSDREEIKVEIQETQFSTNFQEIAQLVKAGTPKVSRERL